jgi:hypothetical protein
MSNSDSKIDQKHDHSADVDTYDRGIVPAETAARKEREGEEYKRSLHEEKPESGDIDTTGGYTIDKEGLSNNYAIEPEMYINEPGDLREENQKEVAERTTEMAQVNETDETGKLTSEHDDRGRGTGIV